MIGNYLSRTMHNSHLIKRPQYGKIAGTWIMEVTSSEVLFRNLLYGEKSFNNTEEEGPKAISRMELMTSLSNRKVSRCSMA